MRDAAAIVAQCFAGVAGMALGGYLMYRRETLPELVKVRRICGACAVVAAGVCVAILLWGI
jgi:hypothetical protein